MSVWIPAVELPGCLSEVEDGQADAKILPFCSAQGSLSESLREVRPGSEWGMMQLEIPDAFGVASAALSCRIYLPSLLVSQAIATPIGHPALSQLAEPTSHS